MTSVDGKKPGIKIDPFNGLSLKTRESLNKKIQYICEDISSAVENQKVVNPEKCAQREKSRFERARRTLENWKRLNSEPYVLHLIPKQQTLSRQIYIAW